LGRWLQNDPIGFAGGDANLTRYVFGQPSQLLDPNGLGVLDALKEQFDKWLTGGRADPISWEYKLPKKWKINLAGSNYDLDLAFKFTVRCRKKYCLEIIGEVELGSKIAEWKFWGGLIKIDLKPYAYSNIKFYVCNSILPLIEFVPPSGAMRDLGDGWFAGGNFTVGAGVEIKPNAGVAEGNATASVYGKGKFGAQWSPITNEYRWYYSGDAGFEIKIPISKAEEWKRAWQIGFGQSGSGFLNFAGSDTPE
jgi:hypothetical protein